MTADQILWKYIKNPKSHVEHIRFNLSNIIENITKIYDIKYLYYENTINGETDYTYLVS